MDIDLLSKMVKEVVMDHDTVTLPGLGSFVTEIVPASFTDRGYTILPPYRRLFFSPKQGDDTLLVDIYRKSNPDASEADATRILVEFLQEMKEVLKVRKTIIFPGLGRLRATKENNFFFVADEDLDIYPAGFGLQPISLKTHEETPEETEAAVAGLANILESDPPVDVAPEMVQGFEPAPEAEPEPKETAVQVGHDDPAAVIPSAVEESPEPEVIADHVGNDEVEEVKKSNWLKITLWVILGIIVIAVLALVIVGRVNPQWLDQFLYSPEELDILYPGKL